MEIKRPTVGHMKSFEQEREYWRRAYAALSRARYDFTRCALETPKEVEEAISFAHHFATKKFPDYQMHAFPTSFQTTDNVIIWREAGKILLGRKPDRKVWQFPGGFVDPKDVNLEKAAERERQEECTIGFDEQGCSVGCICSVPEYIGSFRVDDPRYQNSPDKIMTAVFVSYYVSGTPKAGDDLAQVKWFTKDYIRRRYRDAVWKQHHPLVEMLINKGLL